jgi:hypothetical protein
MRKPRWPFSADWTWLSKLYAVVCPSNEWSTSASASWLRTTSDSDHGKHHQAEAYGHDDPGILDKTAGFEYSRRHGRSQSEEPPRRANWWAFDILCTL